MIRKPVMLFWAMVLSVTLQSCGGSANTVPDLPDLATVEQGVIVALKVYHKRLADDPGTARYWKEYAMVLHAHEFSKDSLICYDTYIGMKPKDFDGHYLAGRALFRTEPEKALPYFEAAYLLRRDYVPLLLALGELYESLGQRDKAKGFYKDALKNDESGTAQLGYGRCLFAEGHLDEALEYALLAQTYASDRSAVENILAQILGKMGKKKEAQEATERAAKKSDLKIKIWDEVMFQVLDLRESYAAIAHRCELYLKSNQRQEALLWLNKAIAIRPDVAENFRNRGLIYFDAAQYNRAIVDFSKLLKLDPSVVDIRMPLALALAKIKRLNAYEKALEDLHKLDPDHLECRLHLAAVAKKAGNQKKAITHLRYIMAKDKKHLSARGMLAEIYFTGGKDAEGKKMLAVLEKISPNCKEAQSLRERYVNKD